MKTPPAETPRTTLVQIQLIAVMAVSCLTQQPLFPRLLHPAGSRDAVPPQTITVSYRQKRNNGNETWQLRARDLVVIVRFPGGPQFPAPILPRTGQETTARGTHQSGALTHRVQ